MVSAKWALGLLEIAKELLGSVCDNLRFLQGKLRALKVRRPMMTNKIKIIAPKNAESSLTVRALSASDVTCEGVGTSAEPTVWLEFEGGKTTK